MSDNNFAIIAAELNLNGANSMGLNNIGSEVPSYAQNYNNASSSTDSIQAEAGQIAELLYALENVEQEQSPESGYGNAYNNGYGNDDGYGATEGYNANPYGGGETYNPGTYDNPYNATGYNYPFSSSPSSNPFITGWSNPYEVNPFGDAGYATPDEYAEAAPANNLSPFNDNYSGNGYGDYGSGGYNNSYGSENQLGEQLLQELASIESPQGSYGGYEGGSGNYAGYGGGSNGYGSSQPNDLFNNLINSLDGGQGCGDMNGNGMSGNGMIIAAVGSNNGCNDMNGNGGWNNNPNNQTTDANGFSVSSTGDPHISANVGGSQTATVTKATNTPDLLNVKNTVGGSTQIGTTETPESNGVAYNKSVDVSHSGANAWNVQVNHTGSGDTVNVVDNNGSHVLSSGQSFTEGDGAVITNTGSGATISQNTRSGGTVNTSITDNGQGLDVNAAGTGNDIISGYAPNITSSTPNVS